MRYSLPLFALLLSLSAPSSGASDIGPLLEKLTLKGVLTPDEAASLAAPSAGAGPDVKLDADFRLRYQYGDNSANTHAQGRARYSLRLGAEAAAGGGVSLHMGLASGSDQGGRSTNQTFGRNMEKKNLYIDYAYAEYAPDDRLRLRGGRMKSVLWDPTDMIWDSDLRPEGLAAAWSLRRGASELFSAAGVSALGESLSEPHDPYLVFVQQGGNLREGALALKAAAAYYAFGNVQGGSELAGRPSAAEGYLKSNYAPGGRYARGYDACHISLEAWYSPAGTLLPGIPSASVFGEYIKNTTLRRNSAGWISGFRLGRRKVEAAGQWQFVWSLRRLEAEAWLDTYPDSDFYGGATGMGGREASLRLGLGRGAAFGLDYYSARSLSVARRERLLQADLTLSI